MKIQKIVICITFYLFSIFAENAELIALLPMGGSGIDGNELVEIEEALRTNINEYEYLEIVDRMPMLSCLRNNGVVESNTCDDLKCAFLMGGFLSLRYVIQSRISNSGESMHVNVRVLDTEKKVIVKQIEEGCIGNISQIKSKLLPKIAKNIAKIRFAGRQFHIAKDTKKNRAKKVAKKAHEKQKKVIRPVKKQKVIIETATLKLSKKTPKKLKSVKAKSVVLAKKTSWKTILLRDTALKTFSVSAVKIMIRKYNYFCNNSKYTAKWANTKGKGHPRKLAVVNKKNTVVDSLTQLMWQRDGSGKKLFIKQIQSYVDKMNSKKYKGYSNWRIPTLEEAMTTVSPAKKGALYIVGTFGKKQDAIWTSDRLDKKTSWVVRYDKGRCNYGTYKYPRYVRLVRSLDKQIDKEFRVCME